MKGGSGGVCRARWWGHFAAAAIFLNDERLMVGGNVGGVANSAFFSRKKPNPVTPLLQVVLTWASEET